MGGKVLFNLEIVRKLQDVLASLKLMQMNQEIHDVNCNYEWIALESFGARSLGLKAKVAR